MRVIVCGDREWSDAAFIRRVLEELYEACLKVNESLTVINGECRGADRIAGEWGLEKRAQGWRVEVLGFPYIRELGRAGGPVRNKQMLVKGKPDLVVAFHDAITHSKGTVNMMEQAEKAGVDVWLLGHPDRVYDG